MLNTDGDTWVPPDWVERDFAAADQGVAAGAGVVQLPREATPPALLEAFRRHYALSEGDTHDHVHAANFGVRGDAYVAVGG